MIEVKSTRADFYTNTVSSPVKYNYYISKLRQDINNLMNEVVKLDTNINGYIVLYDNDFLKEAKSKTDRFRKRLDTFKYLGSNSGYSNAILFDFGVNSQTLTPSNDQRTLIRYNDPKTNIQFTNSSLLYINRDLSSLQLPIENITPVSYGTPEYSYLGGQDDFTNIGRARLSPFGDIYILKSTPNSPTFSVVISLQTTTNVNYLNSEFRSYFPFNITAFHYKNGSGQWTAIESATRTNVFGNTELVFPTVNTNQLKITFTLTSCKKTYRTYSYDGSTIITNLLADILSYSQFETYVPGEPLSYPYYIFHFAMSSLVIGYRTRQNKGIYVSRTFKINEPAHFGLQTTEIINAENNASIEYYIYKRDFSKNGIEFPNSGILIPLLPIGQTSVTNEVIYPPTAGSGATAKTNFTIDTNSAYTVYVNGIALTPVTDYTVSNNQITFVGATSSSNLYTINYIPYHIGVEQLTSIANPSITHNVSVQFSYQDINNGSYIAPYAFNSANTTIKSVYNGTDDALSPIAISSITGRTIAIADISSSYPKIYNSDIVITGDIIGSPFLSDNMYYYNIDNSLVVNWNAVEEQYNSDTTEFGYSELNLIVIMRKNTDLYTTSEVAIKDLLLFYNTFNDYLTNVNDG